MFPGSATAKPTLAPSASGAMAGEAERSRAGRSVTGTCRDEILNELSLGRRLSDRCDLERRRAGRAAVRVWRSFGFVASREVDLRAVRLVVGRAVMCRRWPLRQREASVLRVDDVQAAGCRTHRVRRPIPVSVVRDDGSRHDRIVMLAPSGDGRVTLGYGELDVELRARGLGPLEDFARVEIGEGAWAGVVDLARLRGFRASWHLHWLGDGHGSRRLFDARYPELTAVPAPRSRDAQSVPAARSE